MGSTGSHPVPSARSTHEKHLEGRAVEGVSISTKCSKRDRRRVPGEAGV